VNVHRWEHPEHRALSGDYGSGERSPVHMKHLLRAARSEYDKLDKALPALK